MGAIAVGAIQTQPEGAHSFFRIVWSFDPLGKLCVVRTLFELALCPAFGWKYPQGLLGISVKLNALQLDAPKNSEMRKKPKPAAAKCARCKKPLHGVPRLRPAQLKKLSKSKRRPSRPYGGYYCSSCMREALREKAYAS